MKISPVATGSVPSTDLGSISTSTHSPDKLERAKQIALGETPLSAPYKLGESDSYSDPYVDRISKGVRSLKMKTNASPEQYMPVQEPVENTDGTISDNSGQVNASPEATKPLSPQLAAIARRQRALQVKERELADRERALQTSQPKMGSEDLIARLKSQPLSVLQEHGVTYDQLTDAIISSQNQNPEIQALKQEIKALKEGIDTKFNDQQSTQERSALNQMADEVESLSKEGEAYEMIRERGGVERVLRNIYNHFKKTGEVLDVKAVMDTVENQLLDESLKLANYGKVKAKLSPAQESAIANAQTQQQAKQSGIRTLTNKDTAQPVLDRKARAMAAFFKQK